MPSITVVGSINRDIVAYVDRHPAPGETVLGLRSAMFPGGKGANQAVAAARLRSTPAKPVRLVGRVGADAFGLEMRAFLSAELIDVTGVTDAAQPTGIALITVDAQAENVITLISGANHAWPANANVPKRFDRGDIVICQLEVPVSVVADTFLAARAAGATTLLNPAPYQNIPDAILQTTDILVLNEIELAQVLGCAVGAVTALTTVPAVRTLLARGPRAVIVTLGGAGVLVVDAGRADRIAPMAVCAVDTTGAGDCFVGALAAALMDDEALVAAARFANRAAALSVTREGAAASFPRRQDVDGLA